MATPRQTPWRPHRTSLLNHCLSSKQQAALLGVAHHWNCEKFVAPKRDEKRKSARAVGNINGE